MEGKSAIAALLVALVLVDGHRATPSVGPARTGVRVGRIGPAPPNVLLIVTDDQRAGLSVMPKTRRWLVERGTSFPRGFVTSPVCCPSRASIMTGRYAHNHRVLRNEEGMAERLDQATTVQHYLHGAGYRTALFGKYLNKWPLERDPPDFDRWAMITRTPNDRRDAYVGGEWNVDGRIRTVDTYSTTFLGRRAARFIRHSREPWFLYLAPVAPHRPFVAERRYRDARVPSWPGNPAVFEVDRSDKPGYVRRKSHTYRQGVRVRRAQLRTLMSVDDMVGRVFEALREARALSDTLVFFVSDNGHLWAEHGLMTKGVPYRQAILVPFLARWPGRFPPGAVDRRWAANIDIAPTILQAAGVEPGSTAPMDGRSLLDGQSRRRILTEWAGGEEKPPWAATTTRSHQYVEYYRRGRVFFREYYDLRSDPWQLVNLLHDGRRANNPDVAALHAVLAADRSCAGASCP